MTHTRTLGAAISAWLACASAAALGQTSVVTYVLDNVWLDPDISHPSESAQQMTGSFEWTYEVGDFENGSGQLIDVDFPWWTPPMADLELNVDLTSIEFTYTGNTHDLGLDLTLFLLEPLSPTEPSAIDATVSVFDIQNGVSHQGHVISGTVAPVLDICPGDLSGDGQTDLADYSLLADCMSGPGQPVASGCEPADMDGDGDADMLDFARFQVAFGCP